MICERLKTRNQRLIIERIIVKGTLILDTPTGLGSGDADGDADLVILRDIIEDKALLMGSSITGALRNYLREFEHGYDATEKSLLFGGDRSDNDGEQSPLIVNDALSSEFIQTELRDGVEISSLTGTAVDTAKYDLELLEAGTKFELYFELLIGESDDREQLIRELFIVLQGLEDGEISLGMKKRRGFGRCHVKTWQVWRFDWQKLDNLIEWLNFEHWTTGLFSSHNSYPKILEAFQKAGIKVKSGWKDNRNRFTIQATFTLASPLLIRSSQADTQKAPDDVHLKSRRNGELKSILSGTSLAGVLRHRAERIVNTLAENNQRETSRIQIIDEMFGFVKDNKDNLDLISNDNNLKAQASRLIVHESIIKETNDLVQTRIAIDRFTGGALHGALFQEQPIFANEKTELKLKIELRQPEKYEIGLLLLLLKDLWTGDLPVGSTSSIGRGRLQGKEAIINWYTNSPKKWKFKLKDNKLQVEDLLNKKSSLNKIQAELNILVTEFVNQVKQYE
ncbi:MAG: RAMP superfamily CRISPR-associated protein [Nostoc sp. CmiVER01]|uniref:RAMP superfamily CRISPR-associated protein n=1 Tax=Nostoc sp. CmiVER01 TaxID=3075384 RepID=UPI002AD2EE71|nr:RAMP superfamily CRISPR-associated protein [Nostoc sp. CmiVER01]MDZ8122125.1 RAMP superfamily CRISPR-associated protein [Nostoc sp. CmiVER01]